MNISPAITSFIGAQSDLSLRSLGTNARAAVHAAEVRALDRATASASHAPAQQAVSSVPVDSTRGRNVDMYA